MEAEVHEGVLRGEHLDRQSLPIQGMGLGSQPSIRQPVIASYRFQLPMEIHHKRGRRRSLEVKASPVALPEPGPEVQTIA